MSFFGSIAGCIPRIPREWSKLAPVGYGLLDLAGAIKFATKLGIPKREAVVLGIIAACIAAVQNGGLVEMEALKNFDRFKNYAKKVLGFDIEEILESDEENGVDVETIVQNSEACCADSCWQYVNPIYVLALIMQSLNSTLGPIAHSGLVFIAFDEALESGLFHWAPSVLWEGLSFTIVGAVFWENLFGEVPPGNALISAFRDKTNNMLSRLMGSSCCGVDGDEESELLTSIKV